MAFNFPDAPTANQVFTDTASGAQYIYKSGVWMQSSAAQIRLSALPYNRLVNGAFLVNQEYNPASPSFPNPTTFPYVVDQWRAGCIGTGATASWNGNNYSPKGSIYRLRMVVDTGKPTLAANDSMYVSQPIEGLRVGDLAFHTAGAKQLVARFGVRAPAGTYSVSLANGDYTRTYVTTFTVSAAQANVDSEHVVVIPGDTGGPWPSMYGTARALLFHVIWAYGTVGQTATLNAWTANSGLIAWSGQTNGMATTGNIFDLFDVGLYADPDKSGAAPPWEALDFAEEERACQRYFTDSLRMEWGMYSTGAQQCHVASFFPVEMRVYPALTTVNNGSVANLSAASFDDPTTYACRAYMLTGGTPGPAYVSGRTGSANARM